ncbi:MAG: FhaA domain-containing protein [Thermomicrobiales bacterium]
MKLLDRFEQSMERLMEGSVGSIFRQKMQPAEIGRALEKAMFDHKQVSVGTLIVPNRYTVALNPGDYAQFADYTQGLAHQMERFLFERASEKGASVLDHIQVSFMEDEKAKRGRPTVTCAISDMHRPAPARPRSAAPSRFSGAPAPAQATQPFRPHHRRGDVFVLFGVDGVRRGDTVRLDRQETTVGRSGDNALVIAATDVSRHHARIDLIDGVPRLEDLGSTNGTRVNGQHVRHADLTPGDQVAFGSQLFEVATDGGPR